MTTKNRIAYALLPLCLCAGVAAGIFLGRSLERHEVLPAVEKLQTILSLIDNDYVDEVSLESILERSLPDIIAQLDPHSAYIPASELTAVNDDLEASFSGVGVSFQILKDTVVIVEVIPGGPAEKVGLRSGDRIIEANGKSLAGGGVANDDVYKALRGPSDTKVKLKIKRPGARGISKFEVVRGEIPQRSVDCVYMATDDIGYVRVSKFSRNTYAEFFDALTDLRSRGADRYIIDLRGNSGGYMDQAINMANEFLAKGNMIVYTRGRNSSREAIAVSDGNGNFTDSELIVLTDEYSASASEIFAGAIQDNDRGLVLGRRSFGKGLVQEQTVLPDSSAVRLTVARYYTPSGRSIQKEYTRGKDGKYEMDIIDRYSHGEFYNADSIKLDKSKRFTTLGGRTVYGGGGIMPDVFVPQDTTGYTSYYAAVTNGGLIQRFSFDLTDKYRDIFRGAKTPEQVMRLMPRDETLLNNFVQFAVADGVPARWYYINQSRDLILNQIKALVVRDVLGYSEFIRVLNLSDKTVLRAIEELEEGHSPIVIPAGGTPAGRISMRNPKHRGLSAVWPMTLTATVIGINPYAGRSSTRSKVLCMNALIG